MYSFTKRVVWPIPVFYLALILVCFGVFIPWWGLYGDDWQYLYLFHIAGPSGYPAFVAADRPFSAWVYQLFTPLAGENPAAYHILLLGLRWLAASGFWLALRALWPKQSRLAFVAGALLAVYPGFKQQPLPLEFILHFTGLSLVMFSTWAMFRALDEREAGKPAWRVWAWTAASLIGALQLFSVEYFVGWELARPVMIWLWMRQRAANWKQTLRQTALAYAPYALVLGAFLFWRVFVFRFQFYQPTGLSALASDPLKNLILLGWNAFDDLRLALVSAWNLTIGLQSGLPAALILAAVSLGAAAATWLALAAYRPTLADSEPRWSSLPGLEAIGLGTLAALLSGLPYWVTSIPVEAAFPWDRPLLSFMPGVCLLLAGVIEWALQPRARRVALSLLVGAALGLHAINAGAYRAEWQLVRETFSQLSLRVPGLKPGTAILTQDLPFVYYGDNTLSPMVNWMYAPERREEEVLYRVFDLDIRQDDFLQSLEQRAELKHQYRTFSFSGEAGQVLVLALRPGACARLLGPADSDLPGLKDALSDLTYLSNLDWVQPAGAEAAALPGPLGARIEDDWCAYFERVDLAAQQGDWRQATAWYEAAQKNALAPAAADEYLPAIRAYAALGDAAQALTLSRQALSSAQLALVAQQQIPATGPQSTPVELGDVQPALCRAWNDSVQAAAPEQTDALKEAALAVGCAID